MFDIVPASATATATTTTTTTATATETTRTTASRWRSNSPTTTCENEITRCKRRRKNFGAFVVEYKLNKIYPVFKDLGYFWFMAIIDIK